MDDDNPFPNCGYIYSASDSCPALHPHLPKRTLNALFSIRGAGSMANGMDDYPGGVLVNGVDGTVDVGSVSVEKMPEHMTIRDERRALGHL
jgi:hypothetical protein